MSRESSLDEELDGTNSRDSVRLLCSDSPVRQSVENWSILLVVNIQLQRTKRETESCRQEDGQDDGQDGSCFGLASSLAGHQESTATDMNATPG